MPTLARVHLEKIRQASAKILSDFGRNQQVNSHSVYKYLQNYCLRPSKGVRALLLLLSYLGYSRTTPTPAVYRWAASLELIQNFVLIHDDLIDHSDLRRGGPVLQLGLAKLSMEDQALGQNLALVCGDLLFGLGVRTFMDINAAQDQKEKALKVLLDSACVTALGELSELTGHNLTKIKKAAIYKIYDQKTGEYSFITPLLCGAITAGQNGREIKKLQKFGRLLGRAFQLRDDLLDITGRAGHTGKNTLSDLHDSKITLLAYHAYKKSGTAEQKQMLKIFKKKNKTSKEIDYLKNLLASSGAITQVQRELSAYLNLASKIISSLQLRSQEKIELAKLIETFKA